MIFRSGLYFVIMSKYVNNQIFFKFQLSKLSYPTFLSTSENSAKIISCNLVSVKFMVNYHCYGTFSRVTVDFFLNQTNMVRRIKTNHRWICQTLINIICWYEYISQINQVKTGILALVQLNLNESSIASIFESTWCKNILCRLWDVG